MKEDYRSFATLSFENPSPVFRVATGPLTSFLARSVFVFDKNHIITHVDLAEDISIPINYELMEAKIDEVL